MISKVILQKPPKRSLQSTPGENIIFLGPNQIILKKNFLGKIYSMFSGDLNNRNI